MKKAGRILTVFLAAAVLAPTAALPAGAAAPAVTADETAYVSLDYYGKPGDVSVVKRYSLNGNSTITDYGSYGDILNMSNEAKPSVSGNTVTWSLPQGTQDFYCQYTPKDPSISLPWSFDVSYKLNGAPAKAEALAGVSGLVEIDIKATPNQNVSDYMKNNMLLEVGTAFKLDDTYSLEAPGAQTQTLGEYKAAVFAAVPGEEKQFVLRVGTKKFDTVGIVMMMQPGTLSAFGDIKDLKDDKDTVKDSLDAIHSGTNSVLDTLSGMTGGLSSISSGLSAADEARRSISGGKGSVYKNADEAIADLSAVSKSLSDLIPHMQQGETAVQEVNADINALDKTLTDSSGSLYSLSSHIGKFKSAVNDLRDAVTDLDESAKSAGGKAGSLEKSMKDEAKDIAVDKAAVKQVNAGLNTQIAKLQQDSAALNTAVGETLVQKLAKEALAAQKITSPTTAQMAAAQQQVKAQLSSVLTAVDDYQKDLNTLIASSQSASAALGSLDGESADILSSGSGLIGELDSALDALHDGNDSADNLLKNTNRLGSDMQSVLDSCQKAITETDALNTTANQYKDGAVNALKDAESLTGALSEGVGSAQSFLSSLESLMKSSGSKLNSAAQKSLSGSISVLQKSLEGIGRTDTIRDAGNTIDQTVNKEIDKYEKDNNLLNLDNEARPVSLTSAKNAAPSSVQIVLRTQEITAESNSENIRDQEAADAAVSPIERIQNIFAKIGAAIRSIFSDD